MNIDLNTFNNSQNFGNKKLPYIGKINAAACYSRAVSRITRYDAETETALAIRAKAGNKEDENKLFESSLPLVIGVARKFFGSGLPFSDLIGEGNVGLVEAFDRYDSSHGTAFSTYAFHKIRGKILTALADQSRTIRETRYAGQVKRQLGRATDKLAKTSSGELTDAMIAAEMEITPERVAKIREMSRFSTVSLNTPIGENQSSTILDFISDESIKSPLQDAEQNSLVATIQKFVHKLSPKEQIILKKHYGLDGEDEHTLEEAGAAIGVTRQRAKQIENKALEKLRHPKRLEVLRDYAEC